MTNKKRVLILCTGNSARSQMAEGILRNDAGDRFEVFSAGTKPGSVRPEAVEAMREMGIDISGHRSKSLDEYLGENFDYIITVPGYPRHVEGRQAVAELYRPYGDMIVLDRCHDLAVHHDPNTGVVVLEYASQGRVVPTGTPYANRYISVLTIAERKVSRWRDYLDPVAVFNAVGWPSH